MFRIDEIGKQHKELFPLADESGQINKLQEELTEYMINNGFCSAPARPAMPAA